MIKQFCDRCGAETSDAPAGHVNGIEDADERGNGQVTTQADLCGTCYQGFLDWLAHHTSAEAMLALIRSMLAQSPSADAIDPHAPDPGTPSTRV
jgi:hypothetical protein